MLECVQLAKDDPFLQSTQQAFALSSSQEIQSEGLGGPPTFFPQLDLQKLTLQFILAAWSAEHVAFHLSFSFAQGISKAIGFVGNWDAVATSAQSLHRELCNSAGPAGGSLQNRLLVHYCQRPQKSVAGGPCTPWILESWALVCGLTVEALMLLRKNASR